ncbi:ABC transporter permease [Siminovitchia sediminis]|uniref:ABC transporter permease n=1 Tax=Siminovitchia sediminis TaxID=1274353 RepID=A0ABW4KRB3_9BACI
MTMLINQCRIEILRVFRNPYFVFWSLCMPILFYFIFTKVMNYGNDHPIANAHFLMSMAAFSVMGSAILTLGIRMVEEQTKGWSHYMRITPLSSTIYFFSKIVGQSLVHVFSITIIFLAGALISGVSLPWFQWLMSGCWILLGSLPFLMMGVLVGLMKRVDTAAGVSNVAYMLLAITGGMWMPMEFLPDTVQAIGKSLPAFHYGNGAWEIIRGNAPDIQNVLILSAYFVGFMLLSNYIRKKKEAV